MRFHLLGLAHIPTRRELSSCAYTQKVIKLAKMLTSLGHTLIFYGGAGSQVECSEFVEVLDAETRRETYGDYNISREFFKHDPRDKAHQVFNQRAIQAIKQRAQLGDFLLCPMGNYQKPIADACAELMAVESGIGYSGVFSSYRVFESYAWMHYIYGLLQQVDGGFYDCVIPNYYDPNDFPYQPIKGDYFLYIGRVVKRKGVEVAVQVSDYLGKRLVIAGQGGLSNPVEGLNITSSNVEYIGAVGPEERARLLGGAQAVFVPTLYIEPFGGVAVEAQFTGTPVITTDFGVFSETVNHGVTGWRCRTFDDFVWAAKNADQLNPLDCRTWALENYSMHRVKWMYQEYFTKLADLWSAGWYELHPERGNLTWLNRYYPR